jgi:hypothetical protein
MMCLPAGVLLGASAGLVQAGGQIASGIANDRIARSNASALDRTAGDVESSARLEQEATRLQFGQVIGQQRAGLSASNVDISRGSAANLSADTAAVGELEVLRALSNAAREAYGLRSQAAITRAEGAMARRMGFVNAAGTLLGTASSAFGQARAMGAG